METTIKEGNERLLKLADFLEGLPPGKFNYGTWCNGTPEEANALSPEPACGTMACAMGWATVIPEFKELGLKFAASRYGDIGVCLNEPEAFGATSGSYYMSLRAGCKLFALDDCEFTYLFIPAETPCGEGVEDNAKPVYVAKKIRDLVAMRGDQSHANGIESDYTCDDPGCPDCYGDEADW